MDEYVVAPATRSDSTKTRHGWVVERKRLGADPFPASRLFRFRNAALAEMRRLVALASRETDA
jgi:hypothetical protein